MILLLLQSAAIILVALLLCRWHQKNRLRNAQSWESLLAQLRLDWSARAISENFLWQEGIDASPEDVWQRMEGPKGLLVMYQNTRVLLEMANFAAKNASGVDPVLIATLRSDAMQIRLCVLMSLAQYAFSQASEGVRVNAYRAAEMYTAMAARMTQLLQEHAAVILPDFVAAM